MDIKEQIDDAIQRFLGTVPEDKEYGLDLWLSEDMAKFITDKLFTPYQLLELAKPGAKLVVQCADQKVPFPESIEFELDPSVLMVSKAGVALQKNLLPAYQKGENDMLKAGFVKVV